MLRDADKLDIWRVVTDYYKAAPGNRNPAIELDLPDLPRISDNICSSLLNFPRSFRLLSERGYLETIRDAIYGESSWIEKIWAEIEKHILQQKEFYESNHIPGHRPLNLAP